MWHGRQIRRHNPPVDILAQRDRKLALALCKRLALHHIAQPDRLPLKIRNLNPHCRFTRHALNQNRLRCHRQAKIIR